MPGGRDDHQEPLEPYCDHDDDCYGEQALGMPLDKPGQQEEKGTEYHDDHDQNAQRPPRLCISPGHDKADLVLQVTVPDDQELGPHHVAGEEAETE